MNKICIRVSTHLYLLQALESALEEQSIHSSEFPMHATHYAKHQTYLINTLSLPQVVQSGKGNSQQSGYNVGRREMKSTCCLLKRAKRRGGEL